MSIILENGEPRNPNILLQGTHSKPRDFVFNDGVFYATFEGHLHPRKDADELYQHLSYKPPLPVMTDTGTGRIWTLPTGNYPTHTYKPDFYSAQLLHYGLKSLKTKGPAKKRLLDAFEGSIAGGKTMEVPRAILELEEAMRAWWQESNTGVGSEIQTESTTPDVLIQSREVPPSIPQPAPHLQSSSEMPLAKRKRARRSKQTAVKRTKPSVSSSHELFSDMETRETSVKSLTPLQANAPAAPAAPAAPPSWTRPRVKQTARKTTGMPTYLQKSPKNVTPSHEEASPPRYRTKQTAPMGTGRFASVIPREKIKEYRKAQKTTPAMTGADMRKAIKSLKADQARQVLTALVDKSPISQNALSKEISLVMNGASSSNSKPVDLSQMTGLYDIEAPSIERDSYSLYFTFEVYPSSTSSHLWASFDLGFGSGVMRSVYPAPTSFDTEVYFEWRGRDSSEGIMSFDPENRAIITFLPGGLLEGKMAGGGHGTFKIYGSIQVYRQFRGAMTRKSEDEQRREVRSWKGEWRGLNAHNYDLERTGRWGSKAKWRGDPRDEKAFESDTTAGEMKRPWNIDIGHFIADSVDDSEKWDEEDEEDLEDYSDEW